MTPIQTICRALLLAALIGLSPPVPGQQVDSLRRIVRDPLAHDTVRLQAFRDMIWAGYMYTDPDSAFLLADSLARFAHRVGNLRQEGNGISMMGNVHFDRGEYDKAEAMFLRSMELFRRFGSVKGQASSWVNLANIHVQRGDHQKAVDAYATAADLHEKIGFVEGKAQVLCNIGVVYYAQNDHRPAIEHFDRAMALYLELGIPHQVAGALLNRGNSYFALNDFTLAIKDYERCVVIYDSLGVDVFLPEALMNLGSILVDMGRMDEAEPYLLRAREVSDRFEDKTNGSLARGVLGVIALSRNDTRAAKELGEQAMELAEALGGVNELAQASKVLHRVYKAMGDERRALAMYERYILFRDSLTNEENSRALLRFEYDKKNEQRALADSLRHQQEQFANTLAHADQLGRERNQRNMLVAGLALALLLALGIWARMRYMAKADRAIVAAQAQLIESERQLESEKVRTRIASDIHDDLGSDLTKLGLLGREIKRATAEHPDSTPALADRIVNLSTDAAAALSHIVWAADPEQDSAQGLVGRASVFTNQLLEGTGIDHDLEFAHHGEDRVLDPGVKHDVFMLLKELVNNALKHAQAQRIDASLVTDVHGFRLCVRDEGKGYDADEARKGNGLRSVTARSNRIGARATTTTSPGKGCNVRMEGAWERPVASAQGS